MNTGTTDENDITNSNINYSNSNNKNNNNNGTIKHAPSKFRKVLHSSTAMHKFSTNIFVSVTRY